MKYIYIASCFIVLAGCDTQTTHRLLGLSTYEVCIVGDNCQDAHLKLELEEPLSHQRGTVPYGLVPYGLNESTSRTIDYNT